MPLISASSLRSAIQSVFEHASVAASDAAVVAEHLVEAELCGVSSHGVMRVPQYVHAIQGGKVNAQAKLSIVREYAGTASLDGEGGLGQVMAKQAMDEAIRRARSHGVGAVTLTRVGHTGRLASYAEQATRNDMIGMVFVNAGGRGQWMAPFGGASGRLATNPLAIAVPTSGDPLVIDIATSVAPEGKVRAMRSEGRALPDGWLVDGAGHPSNDSNVLYTTPRGALLPFGGHKGFGLALIIDALAGGLSGAGCCISDSVPMEGVTDGVLLIALDPARFCEAQAYRAQISALLEHVRSAPLAAGVKEILTPGELEHRNRRRGLESGVSVAAATWQSLIPLFAAAGANVDVIAE